ncbi:hypothetical protein BGW38_002058 [Lunasporangiospora selenospora]|uniref:MARVEL domain-containing protein n=1 Tax=Lunasporangiospora selenospora TaxID=979761 RepID=A0A9P6FUQ7_9FUNG|nr:hypothetical protein BGW38_002058 [Lunasporangiospora selenospora]
MDFSPTSRTLFIVQSSSFFSSLIVVICCCLYLNSYPKSPGAGSVSAIACLTLVFALISTVATLVIVLRQKAGRTTRAVLEGCWVGVAILLWILAAVGGIAKPANGISNVTCSVLPDGKSTDDPNFKRACQSTFAATAFCVVTALLFIATGGILISFAIQRATREKNATKVKVGGSIALDSPSQHGRNPSASTPSTPAAGVATTHANETTSPSSPITPAAPARTATVVSMTAGGNFSENVYRTPVLTAATPAIPAPAHTTTTPGAAIALTPAPPMAAQPTTTTAPPTGYEGYGGHVAQGSYHSVTGGAGPGGYNYGTVGSNYSAHAYGPPGTDYFSQGGGHFQQASTASTMAPGMPYDPYGTFNSVQSNIYGLPPPPPPHSQPQQQQQLQQQQQQQQQQPLQTGMHPRQDSYPMMAPTQNPGDGNVYMAQGYLTYQQQQPYPQQQAYPPQQQQQPYPQQLQPYQAQPYPQQTQALPQQPAPVMAMPRPEHFGN